MKCLNAGRVLLECQLEPVQGSRFQPTGFPSLGPAEFSIPTDGNTKALLVESPQSMANRLEAVCISSDGSSLAKALEGMPVITVRENNEFLTNSIKEAHRMNSPYMLEGDDKNLIDLLKNELKINDKDGAVDIPKFAEFVLKYDTNSVLHGLFLSKSDLAGGRYRLTRLLSSFIEAVGIQPAVSGGVKFDHLHPSGGDGNAKQGFGHIPYSRIEYVAESITAYFNIDLSLLHSYQLHNDANDLLFTLALWKIRSFLTSGLRLRTACDLRVVGSLVAKQPDGFTVPDLPTLDRDIRQCLDKCRKGGLLTNEPLVLDYKKKR